MDGGESSQMSRGWVAWRTCSTSLCVYMCVCVLVCVCVCMCACIPRLQRTHAHPHARVGAPPCMCAGGITADYKTRVRNLAFNLRDPLNGELRSQVLFGGIPPSRLVTMTAADLANKNLAAERRKIEEAHDKSIQLDVDTAAKVCRLCVYVCWCAMHCRCLVHLLTQAASV